MAAGVNALLPKDVRVLECAVVSNEFHSRYSAAAKTYEYVLWHEREFCLPQRRRFTWSCGPVDFDAMDAAAREFMGEHDFAAFQNVGRGEIHGADNYGYFTASRSHGIRNVLAVQRRRFPEADGPQPDGMSGGLRARQVVAAGGGCHY